MKQKENSVFYYNEMFVRRNGYRSSKHSKDLRIYLDNNTKYVSVFLTYKLGNERFVGYENSISKYYELVII